MNLFLNTRLQQTVLVRLLDSLNPVDTISAWMQSPYYHPKHFRTCQTYFVGTLFFLEHLNMQKKKTTNIESTRHFCQAKLPLLCFSWTHSHGSVAEVLVPASRPEWPSLAGTRGWTWAFGDRVCLKNEQVNKWCQKWGFLVLEGVKAQKLGWSTLPIFVFPWTTGYW